MPDLRPFYVGENIRLITPTKDLVLNTEWSQWFNSQSTTAYTTHGIFPNLVENQLSFYETLVNQQRVALLIKNHHSENPIGIVSLSSIDLRKQTAAVAIVMDTESAEPVPPLAALEAMALITRHGFDVLGLRRIDAGQVFPALANWNKMLELLGYRTEGVRRSAFKRGHNIEHEVVMGALYEDYEALVSLRGGTIWPGNKRISRELRQLPVRGFAEVLAEVIERTQRDYFSAPPFSPE